VFGKHFDERALIAEKVRKGKLIDSAVKRDVNPDVITEHVAAIEV
jgi:hypothetical protein